MVNPIPVPTITVAGVDVDPCVIAVPVTVRHGRADVTSQPDAPTLVFTVLGPVAWGRNDPVILAVDGGTRFAGFIDSLTTEMLGDEFSTMVQAVGWQAKAGTVKPSIPPRDVEDDVARASAYLDVFAAGFTEWTYRVQGDPQANLVRQDVDGGHTVLDLVRDVCDSTGGLLWQAKDGALVYGTATHRSGLAASMFIGDCDIVDGIQWVKDGATLVNRVRIQYGDPNADPRAVYVSQDTSSITDEGVQEASVDSLLNTQPDALLLGELILYRRAQPYWSVPGGVVVRSAAMTPQDYTALLDLDISSVVLVNVAREPGEPENVVEWVVEGWQEEWGVEHDELHHTMWLSLSDRQRFGATGLRTVGEVATEFTVGTAAALTVRELMFKEII